MEIFLVILVLTAGIALTIDIIKFLIGCARKIPTWKGIIGSTIFGLLPLYLILCFFGLMGDERNPLNQ